MTPPADPERYKNHRFPGEIISHGVWLYYRFPLSYRDVQELLFGLCRKFCSGGHEGTVVPVGAGITRPERRTVRPQ